MSGSHPPPAGAGGDAASSALSEALALASRLLRTALWLMLPAYLLSGLHIIRPHERAVPLLFGRIPAAESARVWTPGVHWTLPRPFAEVVRLDTGRIKTADTGAFDDDAVAEALRRGAPDEEWKRLLLAGDVNLLRARWALRYRIGDPAAYVFSWADPDAAISNEFRRAVLHATAGFAADRALRTDVDGLRAAIETGVRDRLDAIGAGIRVERVEALALAPPPAVAAAFDAVIQAEQEQSARISEARETAARRANEAIGEAARRRSLAEAYRDRLIAETDADADYFRKILPQYAANPRVIAEVLRQDGVRRALARAGETFVVRGRADGRQELRLWIGPEPKRPEDHANLR